MFKLAGVEKNNDAKKSKERKSSHTDKPAEVPQAETEKERYLLNGAHMISHLNQSVTSLDNKRIYSSFEMTNWVQLRPAHLDSTFMVMSPQPSPMMDSLNLSGDVPLKGASSIPSFPLHIVCPVPRCRFLRYLYILAYSESLQHSKGSASSMSREEPNFMKMVQDMQQNLCRCVIGRLMQKGDHPDEKALGHEWTRQMKKIYSTSTTASMSHTNKFEFS